MNLEEAMTIKLDYELPEYPAFDPQYRRAPRRESHLSESDKALAIKNALRYIHPDHHAQMAKEFAQELEEHGCVQVTKAAPPQQQISLMDLGGQTVLNKLRMTDVNILSPIEALNLLAELKQDLNG